MSVTDLLGELVIGQLPPVRFHLQINANANKK
jgi:hypothetical protein